MRRALLLSLTFLSFLDCCLSIDCHFHGDFDDEAEADVVVDDDDDVLEEFDEMIGNSTSYPVRRKSNDDCFWHPHCVMTMMMMKRIWQGVEEVKEGERKVSDEKRKRKTNCCCCDGGSVEHGIGDPHQIDHDHGDAER